MRFAAVVAFIGLVGCGTPQGGATGGGSGGATGTGGGVAGGMGGGVAGGMGGGIAGGMGGGIAGMGGGIAGGMGGGIAGGMGGGIAGGMGGGIAGGMGGGAAPVIDCAKSQCFPVPPTDVTGCQGASSVLTSCPGTAGSASCGNTPFCGQDAQYPNRARTFTCYDAAGGVQSPCDAAADTGEVVVDSLTGLTWQRTRFYYVNWSEAGTYCTDLVYGGRSDWRLPSPHELSSLYDVGDAALDVTAFPYVPGDEYWTSAPYLNPTYAWSFNAMEGYVGPQQMTLGAHVRCVRGGLTAPTGNRYTVSAPIAGEEIVSDAITGLVWAKTTYAGLNGNGQEWAQALTFCENLMHAGHDDWRLPDKNELASLVTYNAGSSIASLLPGARGGVFWSSSPVQEINRTYAWGIDMSSGQVHVFHKTSGWADKLARCVRAGP